MKSAIVYAAGNGQAATMSKLLDQGILPDTTYPNGLTARMWARAYRHLTTVQILIDPGADARRIDDRGKKIIQMAEEKGHMDIVKYFNEGQ